MKTIYMDNAATTKTCRAAINAMVDAMENRYGNPSGLHDEGQLAKETLEEARQSIADLLGAKPGEIYFTSGGSEADNQALISAAKLGEKKGKKHIVSTAFEHHAVLHTLKKLQKMGFEVELLPIKNGICVTAEQVKKAIREDTCLVSVMFANNEVGSVMPIAEIGKVCRERGVLFHTDAVQAVGHVRVNVAEQNIDMLSLSAHKFHGPKGVGVLYVKKGILLTNLIEGGGQERGKRAGTENVPGIVNFCFEGIEGESLLLLLNAKGVCVSSGSACTSSSLLPSHVLLAIGCPKEVAHGSVRLSLCEENTEEEVDFVLKELPETVEYLRSISPVWRDLTEGKTRFLL